jgi:hypothetical protein
MNLMVEDCAVERAAENSAADDPNWGRVLVKKWDFANHLRLDPNCV